MTFRLLYISFLLSSCLLSQNLVRNAGFEEPISKRFNKEGAWKKCMSSDSPDYFTDSVSASLFKKYLGGSEPHSGNSFIGLFIYRKQEEKKGEVREFVQSQLLHPLKRDTVYYVEAFLRMDKESNVLCDGFTMYFSDTVLHPKKVEEMFDHTPQVFYKARHYLDSRDGWVKFSGSFKAKGNERYLVIGNLKGDEQTGTRGVQVMEEKGKKKKWFLRPSEEVAYVYIDDIKVIYSDSLNIREHADYLKTGYVNFPKKKKIEEPALKICVVDKVEREVIDYLNKVSRPVMIDSTINFRTTPIKKGQVFNLKNIQFEYDKAEFKEEAIPELNDLVKLMRENKSMEIEIRGHTDNHGGLQYNIDLSIARANAVEKFLVKNGISKKRVQSYGYGSAKPIESNESEEGRAKNRRIELIIIKE